MRTYEYTYAVRADQKGVTVRGRTRFRFEREWPKDDSCLDITLDISNTY